MELLYPRAAIVTAAKAYGLDAIDLVCVTYRDTTELELESREGRQLGFDGKVCCSSSQRDSLATNDSIIARGASSSSSDDSKSLFSVG